MLQTDSRYLSWPRKNNILGKLRENGNVKHSSQERLFVVSADRSLSLSHGGQGAVWSEEKEGTVHQVAPKGGVGHELKSVQNLACSEIILGTTPNAAF